MPRFRKRPPEVSAEQWFPGKDVPGVRFHPYGGYYVVTIQGQFVNVTSGTWIIQESDGVSFYPCDPVEFERIYEIYPSPAETAAIVRDEPRWQQAEEQRADESIDRAYLARYGHPRGGII